MNIIDKPITGQESDQDRTTPYSALVSFYYAFNNRNIELMKTNWLLSEESSMSNPLGGIKRGWEEINSVYKNIFNSAAKVYVEFYAYSIHSRKNMFIAVGRERGKLEINQIVVDLDIRTTRTYLLHNSKWKQIHHHGSMDNPELLATYQTTLIGK